MPSFRVLCHLHVAYMIELLHYQICIWVVRRWNYCVICSINTISVWLYTYTFLHDLHNYMQGLYPTFVQEMPCHKHAVIWSGTNNPEVPSCFPSLHPTQFRFVIVPTVCVSASTLHCIVSSVSRHLHTQNWWYTLTYYGNAEVAVWTGLVQCVE